EIARQSRQIAGLKQTLAGILDGDERVTNDDYRRIKQLVPGTGLFDSDESARAAMAELRKLLDDIRKRPLAADPRTTGDRPASGNEDPMNLDRKGAVSPDNPLGLDIR